ncbi:MAG: protein translocase subunit SecF [Pseudomonadota bacterium]
MELIRPNTNIDFIGKQRIAFIISITLILISIGSLIVKGGPNYGIDFAGGVLIQLKSSQPVDSGEIRNAVDSSENPASVQQFGERSGNEYLIRAKQPEDVSLEEFVDKIKKEVESIKSGNSVEVRRVEMVGPKAGKELRERALKALFYTILLMAVYISGRFEFKWLVSLVVAAALVLITYFLSLMHVPITILIIVAMAVTLTLFTILNLKYAMGAVVALIHDAIITVGALSLTGKEFNLSTIAAILTILGYSINDTIVIFDRIRENLRKHHKDTLKVVINRSVNETLGRTIITSGTALLSVIALMVFGGDIIYDFAFALFVGFVSGCYSTIYIANPIILLLEKGVTPFKKRFARKSK